MARRGSRVGRRPLGQSGGYDDQFSSTTIATLPSGVTIDKNAGIVAAAGVPVAFSSGATIAKIDFGQGTQYKIYRGVAGVSGAGGPTTRISAGTCQINTGLTSVVSFQLQKEMTGTTVGSTGDNAFRKAEIGVQLGYAGGAGVTLVIANNAMGAVTPASSLVTDHAGCSFAWIAIGT